MPATLDVYESMTSRQYDPGQRDLVERWAPLSAWQSARIAAGAHPQGWVAMSRLATKMSALDPAGRPVSGLNFASQDYLSLTGHPALLAAAATAVQRAGLHAAGTVPFMGLSTSLVALETRIAQFLRMAGAAAFPSGAEANRAAIRALLCPDDHAIIDAGAHAGFFEMARAITNHVHRAPHGSAEGVERRLRRLRRENPRAGILVVVPAVATFTSVIPDLAQIVDLCREMGATLLVDTAHDLGAMGPTGRGILELQGQLGRVDVVTGSFAKSFACNGGFVASRNPVLQPALRFSRGGQGGSSAMSPVQAAMILQGFDIIESPDGAARRQRLSANVLRLRNLMMVDGLAPMGRPSPLVPLRFSSLAQARRLTQAIEAEGILVNLVENPAVAAHAPRWRIQMMADHSAAEIDQFATTLRQLMHIRTVSPRSQAKDPADKRVILRIAVNGMPPSAGANLIV